MSRPPSSTAAGRTGVSSEPQLQADLHLARVEDVPRGVEAGDGRHVRVEAAPYRVEVADVRTVEQVEHVHADLGAGAATHPELARHPHVDAAIARAFQAVALEEADTIGVRVPVAVGVAAREH